MDNNLNMPLVTVLMPVYNGAIFLKETINSVLNQTYADFIFLIIDDGSTDDSVQVIESFTDKRIQFIKNESNLKLISTLNKGLNLCSTKYICRMDCDDICEPTRLKEQVEYMEMNPDVGASGTFIKLLRKNNQLEMRTPLNDDINSFMLFNSPIAHPSVILRRNVLVENQLQYNSEYIHAEDFKLWQEISNFSKLGNIGKSLLKYRIHEKQITSDPKNKSEKQNTLSKIRTEQLSTFGVSFSDEEFNLHQLIAYGLSVNNKNKLLACYNWLIRLYEHNNNFRKLEDQSLCFVLHERAIRVAINSLGLFNGFIFYLNSGFRKKVKLSFKTKFKLLSEFKILIKRYINR